MTAVLNFQRALSDRQLTKIPESIANWYNEKRPDYIIFKTHRGWGVCTVWLSDGQVHTWYIQLDGGWSMRHDETVLEFEQRMDKQSKGIWKNGQQSS